MPILVYILLTTCSWSQSTANFYVQHIQDDVSNSGETNTSFTDICSVDNAIELANNNRKSHAGRSDETASNLEGDDLSGARILTATNTLSYYRSSGSLNSDMRFNTSIWEYTGPSGGNDEFIVRGRYAVSLNGSTNSVTETLSGIIDANNCIPFITGISNSDTTNGAHSGTAIAYLENSTTLRIHKGSNYNNVTVYIVLVEFTGSNWTVLHGDSGTVNGDSGTITLRDNSDGTGTATNVSNWDEAVIFAQFKGDNTGNSGNQALADLWPRLDPGSDNQSVDWNFHSNHDSNGNNRHFTHVLVNSGMNVTRFQNSSNAVGEVTIDISSAALNDVNQAFIVGSSTSSGNGTAYARGWRNYYLNSTTQAAHWSHRSGNTMSHELQIVDLSNLYSLVDTDGDGVYDISDLDDDNDGLLDSSETGDTDGDGVPDSQDLDDDNDGIPTVVELGLIDIDRDGSLMDFSFLFDFFPVNGVSDFYEGGATIIDSDSDGTPDYLDLDSDNDSVFDALEYDGLGDVDISGNGYGLISDSYESCPSTNNQDGDGIISNIDDNDDGVGNDFGMTTYANPIDSDSDGTPDYLDIDSYDASDNLADGSDIDAAIYVFDYVDADADGLVFGNSTTDADGDGILDDFDTDDTTRGSPRNLDDSYSLVFDGRNDYVEDSNVISSGGATLMAWIKSDGDNTNNNDRVVVGQTNFYLQINDIDNTVSVVLNGSTLLTSTSAVTNGVWAHIGASTTSGETVLYVNGIEEGSSTTGGISTDTSSFTIGKIASTTNNYFYGEIDEVKVFNSNLSTEYLQKVVYQELDHTNSFNSGLAISTTISGSLGSHLVRYFKLDGYQDGILDNKVTSTLDTGSGATLYNLKQVRPQTAPLPYETVQDGAWTDPATWLHGDVWDISSMVETNIADGYNAPIIRVRNDLTVDTTQSCLGLIVDNGAKFSIQSGSDYGQALYSSWFVWLNGTLDLEDESQLIQTEDSFLVTSSSGELERDQQGTANSFTYNYWSSPVSLVNTSSNNVAFTIQDVLYDGTIPDDATRTIDFGSSHTYADVATVPDPIRISSYWLYRFINSSNDYSNWEYIGNNTASLNVTEGFTMKGTSSTGDIDPDVENQNFVFIGKPNNAPAGSDLVHTTFPGTFDTDGNPFTTLTGNPFPSALDANAFINDNISSVGGGADGITGTLYFWEHWSDNTHNLSEYQGGYATYTLVGGTSATSHPDIDQGGTGNSNKTPGRYIPVGQGFFVTQHHDDDGMGNLTNPSNGSVIFRNSQRVFEVEEANTNSVFHRGQTNSEVEIDENEDQKIWFKFETSEGYSRQLLLGFLDGATDAYDRGYDGTVANKLNTDLYFTIENKKCVIQGLREFDDTKEIPLYLKVAEENSFEPIQFSVELLENFDERQDIYLKDAVTGSLQNIKTNEAILSIEAGEYTDRFSIVFSEQTALSTDKVETVESSILIRMSNKENVIHITNKQSISINSAQLYNTLGQQIKSWNTNLEAVNIQLPVNSLQTGVYILKLETDGKFVSKKIIIE